MSHRERAILMIAIDSPALAPILIENIKDDRFFGDGSLRGIFNVIKDMVGRGELPTMATVMDATQGVPQATFTALVKSIEGIAYGQMERFLYESIEKLIWEKKKKSLLRAMIEEVESPAGSPRRIIQLARELEVSSMAKENPDFETANKEYEAWIMRGPTGMNFGMPAFDRAIDGFNKGEVVVICGRPTTAKTMFMINAIEHLKRHTNMLIGLFSLEMAAPTIVERFKQIYFRASRYELKTAIETGTAKDEEFLKLYENLSLHTKNYSISEIARIVEDDCLDIVFIDFLNIVRAESEGKRYEKTTQVILDLKRMAKDQNVLVVVLAQLNRIAGNGSLSVTMDMIRDSGQIEEVADFIFGLCRPEIAEKSEEKWKNLVCIGLLKNKRGPTTSARVFKDPNTGCMTQELIGGDDG